MRFLSILSLAIAASSAQASTFPGYSFTTEPTSEIKNVLSHYCIILDTKTYSDLSKVYTSDAVADFTTIGLGVLKGLPAIETAMNASLFGIPTQHGMTTSYVSDISEKSANATSYYTLQQFGTGNNTGQLFTVWGKWVDELVYDNSTWKVKNRQVVAMGGPLIGNFIVPTH
ncbi:uncharacterized protein LY89DRAFT_686845 [Mollisia scopiformis]|uniref:SnoaL-like domain-containing protein n=1 Tax=Mollisia scopiformis TaxID=149040 RepID=A0A194X2E6_MOLSC|nr:uncharacterized protein LY89DRAFT_686845 [Mollisia scopiformis]KUJ14366.1 hypothetical protein LY89DRAFT_686845 [Mollisia scopiformis]